MNFVIKAATILSFSFLLFSCSEGNEDSFAYGNFESDDILVPSENNGIVMYMNAEEGMDIKVGSLIAVIDTAQYYLQMQQVIASRKAVNARLAQINSEISVQEINVSNLEREYERFGSLFLEDAATKKQMDDFEGKLSLAKARLESLNTQKLSVYAEMEAKDAQVESLKDRIESSRIKAPLDGQVLDKFIKEGEMAMAGRPVVKIADLSELILRVFIDGDQLSSIKIGDSVEVLYDGDNGLDSTKGIVSWISPEAEFTPQIIQTREERVNLVYAVKVRVPNDGAIKTGMPGEIQLLKAE